MSDMTPPGLTGAPRSAWPKISRRAEEKKAIERLVPNSDLHARVLAHITNRIKMSERKMSNFYARWQNNERRVQAYIDLPNYEKIISAQNDSGKAPGVVQIQIPYTWATISSIVTYVIHTMVGQKPMFQVSSHNPEFMQNAQNMETVLQHNADHTRMIKDIFRWLFDAETYGVGAMKCLWMVEKRYRSQFETKEKFGFLNSLISSDRIKTRKLRTIFEGNDIECVDPYLFFPDPNVPMVDCPKKGEFMFVRSFAGKHDLKKSEGRGELKWVDYVGKVPNDRSLGDSQRSLRADGDSIPGRFATDGKNMASYIQKDVGTCEIIPAELGLSSSERVEKWIFVIGNSSQILMAEPFEADHDMHPFAVTEPYDMGHGFGNMGMADMMGPMQDTVSWFINSHIHNVRTALNNMFVVDPSMIEMKDLKNPEPGKLVRLKRAAFGQDVRTVLQQLQVQDVTGSHMDDLESITRFADGISAITDNVRGLQDSGSRKTATEVRTSGEAAASRLASHVRLISAQGFSNLTEMMSLNYQQNVSEEFQFMLLGKDGVENPIKIGPENLVGDFNFPIHDGTLPLDRVAMVDVWKELFMTVSQDPNLSQRYDSMEIFKLIGDLSGAKGLDKFELQPMPDEALMGGMAAGNVVPLSGGQTPGTIPNPGDRLAGGE